ncbi:MAG: DMT family transporter [Alphaproteobacteria bacterium]|nr:DMT family transporter [Alphaproteobacteria bacterium]
MRRERLGILAAVLSSSLGGTNTAVTRFAIGASDPMTLAALRFGLGFVLLLPVAFALRSRWPRGWDWLGVAALGILFFGIFMSGFNLALRYTSAARGALALSILPLLTMVAAALLRIEGLTLRKIAGVAIAIGGVVVALVAGLADAPAGAWQGDLVMIAASLCFALYNVWSRPFIARSSALAFVTAGMGSGSACLAVLAWGEGGWPAVGGFDASQWLAVLYLGASGGALTFFLWVVALEHTTPTRVASTITLNPVTAALLAAILLGEPIGANLLVGVVGVGTGLWIASTDRRMRRTGAGLDPSPIGPDVEKSR